MKPELDLSLAGIGIGVLAFDPAGWAALAVGVSLLIRALTLAWMTCLRARALDKQHALDVLAIDKLERDIADRNNLGDCHGS